MALKTKGAPASQRELELEDLLSTHVKELKILKSKLSSNENVSQSEIDSVKVLPSMVDPEVISPLITIYESRISELLALDSRNVSIQKGLENDVAKLTNELEGIHQAKLREIEAKKANNAWHDGDAEGSESLYLQISELQERLSYVDKERVLLIQQKETLATEVDKISRAKSESDLHIVQLNQDVKELKYTQTFLDQLLLEKDETVERLVVTDRELAGEKSKGLARMEALRSANEGLHHFKSLSMRLEAEKKDLQLHLDDQSDALSEKVQTFAGRIRELQAKLSKKQHECEVLQANQRTLQRDLEQLKMDNKGMVQLMANMEKKIGEFVAREDRTNKLARECKEAAEKALLEKDQKIAAESYLRGELERLRENRVKEFEERSKQHREALTVVKQDCSKLIKSKDDSITRLHEENERLNVGFTLAVHAKSSVEVQLSQVMATLESERRLIKDRCVGLEERLVLAEERAVTLQHELERARGEHRTEQQILQRAQREVERRQQYLEEKRGKLEGDYSELEQALELAVVARERAEHDKALLVIEKESLVASCRRLEAMENECREKTSEADDLTQKLAQLKVQYTNDITYANSTKETQKSEIQFLKNDKMKQEDILFNQLKREREAVSALTNRSMEINIKCGEFASEVHEMRSGYREAVERAEQLEMSHEEACRRISELSIRLAEFGTKEQRHIREESKLKSELAKLRFSLPGHQQEISTP